MTTAAAFGLGVLIDDTAGELCVRGTCFTADFTAVLNSVELSGGTVGAPCVAESFLAFALAFVAAHLEIGLTAGALCLRGSCPSVDSVPSVDRKSASPDRQTIYRRTER